MNPLRPALVLLSILLAGEACAADKALQNGQLTYLRQCKKCHGLGTRGATLKNQMQWDALFESGGIVALHAPTKAAVYFRGATFQAASADLHTFLHHYASDSGNVPVCE